MPKKYQQEIEEILQQAGDLGSGPSRPPKQGFVTLVWDYFKQSIGGSALSITPGRVMLGGALVLLAALVLNVSTGSSLVGLLGWLGFTLLVVGYAMFFIKPKQFEKRWRGDVIQYQGESLWGKIRRRFQR